jgi:hypothetical protein
MRDIRNYGVHPGICPTGTSRSTSRKTSAGCSSSKHTATSSAWQRSPRMRPGRPEYTPRPAASASCRSSRTMEAGGRIVRSKVHHLRRLARRQAAR